MKKTKASENLERRQKNAWRNLGGSPNFFDFKADSQAELYIQYRELFNTLGLESDRLYDEKMVEELLEKNRELLKKYPLTSPFQDPNDYIILMGLHNRLKKASEMGVIDIPDNVVLGTMPYGASNGYTCTFNDGSHLIILQTGLFHFINLNTKIILQLLPFEENNGKLSSPSVLMGLPLGMEENSELKARLFDLYESYIIHGHPLQSLPYLERTRLDSSFEFLLTGAELFALAHEYAHILLGHTQSFNGQDIHSISNKSDIAAREFEADILGAKMAISTMSMDGIEPDLTVLAIFVFFWTCDLAEEAINAIQFENENLEEVSEMERILIYMDRDKKKIEGEISLGDYPAPKCRLKKVLEALQEDEKIKEHLNKSEFSQYFLAASNGLKMLQFDLVEHFRSLHKQGIKASAIILPKAIAATGNTTTFPKSWWQKVVRGYLTSTGEAKSFYLRYLMYLAPQSFFETYTGLMSDDEEWRQQCREILIRVQPMYRSYLPRLMERFEEEKAAGNLDQYIFGLSHSPLLLYSISEFLKNELEADENRTSHVSELDKGRQNVQPKKFIILRYLLNLLEKFYQFFLKLFVK